MYSAAVIQESAFYFKDGGCVRCLYPVFFIYVVLLVSFRSLTSYYAILDGKFRYISIKFFSS